MPPTVAKPAPDRHALLSGIGKAQPAKSALDLGRPEWVVLGQALDHAIRALAWSSKVAAGKVGVDEADLGKMRNGNRNTPVDRVLTVEELRWHFVVGLARALGHQVDETITRRHALPLQRTEET